jgi:hypothetical protein
MGEAKTYFKGGKGQTGHFTQVCQSVVICFSLERYAQIVWKGTRKVACAVSACPKGSIYDTMASKFYVCRYLKPGNVYGQYKQNVGRWRR